MKRNYIGVGLEVGLSKWGVISQRIGVVEGPEGVGRVRGGDTKSGERSPGITLTKMVLEKITYSNKSVMSSNRHLGMNEWTYWHRHKHIMLQEI